MNRTQRAARLRPLIQQQVDRSNIRDVAGAVGVPHTTLHSFVTGATPQAATLNKIEQWLEQEGLLNGGTHEPAADEQTAEDTFRYFEGTIRQMGGAGNIDAGELKLRRLDALEGLRRFFSARGAVPGWWYRIKEKVDNDEY